MAETIDIPQIGPVKKSQVIAVGGIAAGIVLYAFWRARGSSEEDLAAEVAPEPEDPYQGLTEGGFGGAVGGYDSSSSGSGSDTKTSAPRTNAEWTQLAADKLIGSYDPQPIDAALGRYLGRQPLTTLDQEIVRAAIARAGYPPEGGPYAVISGGDTPVMVAPSGVSAKQSADGSTIAVSWAPVAGAASYYVYRSDQGGPTVASGTSATLYHVDPGYTYKIAVAAVSASGKTGPKSAQVDVKTVARALTGPKISTITPGRTDAVVTWGKVTGATQYQIVSKGAVKGATSNLTYKLTGLKPNATYNVQIQATAAGTKPVYGPTRTFKTKK